MSYVSVIIPTFNRIGYVQETIDSVLAQSYRDYEILVVDDGSTDGTGEALRARYGDSICYVWQQNQGESVARNRGIEAAQGRFLAFLDSDDLWQPDFLDRLVGALEANPEAVLACCQAWLIDKAGRQLGELKLNDGWLEEDLSLEALCLGNRVGPPGTVLIRREYLDATEGFDPEIRYGEDWDLWLRLRWEGPFMCLQEPLACVRVHRGAQCHNPRPETVDQRLRDYLRLLDQVFQRWEQAPDGLREQALACQYADIAFMDYAIGRVTSGRERLGEAARIDPAFYGNLERLAERLLNTILGVALVQEEVVKEPFRKAQMALRHWPPDLPVPGGWKAKVLGDLCVRLAFISYAARDRAGTRYSLTRMVWADPSRLGDPGIWSIGAEAFLGRKVADGLRIGFRRVVPRSPST